MCERLLNDIALKSCILGNNLHGLGTAQNFRALLKYFVVFGSTFVALQAFWKAGTKEQWSKA